MSCRDLLVACLILLGTVALSRAAAVRDTKTGDDQEALLHTLERLEELLARGPNTAQGPTHADADDDEAAVPYKRMGDGPMPYKRMGDGPMPYKRMGDGPMPYKRMGDGPMPYKRDSQGYAWYPAIAWLGVPNYDISETEPAEPDSQRAVADKPDVSIEDLLEYLHGIERSPKSHDIPFPSKRDEAEGRP